MIPRPSRSLIRIVLCPTILGVGGFPLAAGPTSNRRSSRAAPDARPRLTLEGQ